MSIWRWLATALAVLGGLWPAHAGLAHQETGRRPSAGLMLGYYVPYDATSWASLQAHASDVDIVAGQWVTIDPCGGLTTRDDQSLKQFAQSRGLMLEPSLFTASAWLDHRLLTDDASRSAALQNIVAYTVDEGYDGFDLDLEGVDPSDREALTGFVAELGARLHANGKLLTLALPAKERDVMTGWSGAFDYAALGAQADLVTIMAYEYRGPFSGPGSVAPYAWVERVATFASQQIARDKVLLGLAFYGYDWNTTSGGVLSLGYPRAAALAEHEQAEPGFDADQRSFTFSYTSEPGDAVPPGPTAPRPNHQITTRTSAPCDVVPPSPPPTPRPPTPVPDTPQAHEVWVEDSQSAAARIRLADGQRLRGIAAWRLGLEDPNVWPLLEQWRQVRDSVP
ncbi:MAG TPA: glycosyl hydrolase family 18 protein [Chloroflexota bacterium]